MLSAQQAAAKEAAHRRFGYPPRATAERHGNLGNLEAVDKLPRFRPGVEGIGIAGDVLRIYVLEYLAADLETPAEIEGIRTERVLTTGFHDLAEPRQTRLSPAPCGVSIGYSVVTTGPLVAWSTRRAGAASSATITSSPFATLPASATRSSSPALPTLRVRTTPRQSRPCRISSR